MPRCSPAEPMDGVEIITFGCRLNAAESEQIRHAAGKAGLADAVIVNTCAVTAEAERQARQAIRRARREHPDARIIVTGCAATLAPSQYAAMPEIDLVLDNDVKLKAESYGPTAPHPNPLPARGARERAGAPSPRPVYGERAAERSEAGEGRLQPPAPKAWEGEGQSRARSYLQVQQGCDHRCTFCIIPYARGP